MVEFDIRPGTSPTPEFPSGTVINKGAEAKQMIAENASKKSAAPPSTEQAREQLSTAPAVPSQTSRPTSKGEHTSKRAPDQPRSFLNKIASLLTSSSPDRPKEAENKAVLERFQGEIKALSQALKKGDAKATEKATEDLIFAAFQVCDKRSVPEHEKEQISKALVDTILKAYSGTSKKNPEFMNTLSSNVEKNGTAYLTKALLLNNRFDASQLSSENAAKLLKATMTYCVGNFFGISREMLPVVKTLAEKSQCTPQKMEQHISTAIAFREYDLADRLVELHGSWKPQADKEIKRAIQDQDVALAKLLVKHDPAALEKLVHQCVSANLESFLGEILKETGNSLTSLTWLTPDKMTEFSEKAYKNGNLSLMKMLNPDAWQEKAVNLFEKEFKELPNEKKSDKLIQFFLNSDIADAKKFSTLLKGRGFDDQLNQAVDFMDKQGRLIARFPNPLDQQEMHEKYCPRDPVTKEKIYPNYEQQQVAYGNGRHKEVAKIVEGLKKDKSQSLESVYFKLKKPSENLRGADINSQTAIGGRYAMFKTLAFEKLAQGRDGATNDVKLMRGNEVQVTFHTEDQKEVKLTAFKPLSKGGETNIAFYHTAPPAATPGTPPPWLSQMGISEDWNEILQMNVDKNDAASMQKFTDKVAEFYWKGVQLMPTERGNSQTMLELHNVLYQYHGLTPPAASRNAVLPDCIALCSTLEEFKSERYATCWDFG
ncbi:MAG: hypothetical protein LLG04_16040 [Parachlamydia sp.]|nr:hypothetical protein [Parachlamydia sp.]